MAIVWENIRQFLGFISPIEPIIAASFFVTLVVIFGLNMSKWALHVTFGIFWGGLVFACLAFAFTFFGWQIDPRLVLYSSVIVTVLGVIFSKVVMPY